MVYTDGDTVMHKVCTCLSILVFRQCGMLYRQDFIYTSYVVVNDIDDDLSEKKILSRIRF